MRTAILATLVLACLGCGDSVPMPPATCTPPSDNLEDCFIIADDKAIDINALPGEATMQAFCTSRCTRVPGGLNIALGENAADLNFLRNVRHVRTSLSITNSPLLEDLKGLENLETVGFKLEIRNNERLTSLDGLDNLRQVGDWDPDTDVDNVGIVAIERNASLRSISGLKSLKKIGVFDPETESRLTIESNGALEVIDGPPSLEEVQGLQAINNGSLKEIRGFENLDKFLSIEASYNKNLTTIQGFDAKETVHSLTLKGNTSLTQCTITELRERFQPVYTDIDSNGPTCN